MKPYLNKYIKEVEDTLNRLSIKANKEKNEKLKKYIGTNLEVLGLVSKVQIETYKKGFSFFSDDKEKTFLILNEIFLKSSIFEVKNQAFLYLDRNHKHLDFKIQLDKLPLWVKQVDNWAHSDSLSKYMTRLLEQPETENKILAILKKWNRSKNLWERRQSLIALYYYARTKKRHISFELTAEFIKPVLEDPEYFVQKAIGWTLRETYNVYPGQAYEFIANHIKHITPTAFTTSIEKMTDKEKLELKKQRKK